MPQDATPTPLTPVPDGGFVYDLRLARRHDGRTVAAWIAWAAKTERICWRTVGPADPGPVYTCAPLAGHPARPSVVGDMLLWTEYAHGRGSAVEAALDSAAAPAAMPRVPAALAVRNCGHLAGCAPEDGGAWLTVEDWSDGLARIRLLRLERSGWVDHGVISDADAFCRRPQLHAGRSGVLAAWDTWRKGERRVEVAEIAATEHAPSRPLPCPPGCSEGLPALVCTHAGEWIAARCRETLVDLEGALGFHSRLVVCALDGRDWRDIAEVEIDAAMNPWLAAYWGFRRFARLVAAPDAGAYLLWEEKEDERSMDPCPGRLCAMHVAAAGETGSPRVLVRNRTLIAVEEGAPADSVCLGSRVPPQTFEWHAPFVLDRADLTRSAGLRPPGLASNAAAPVFRVADATTKDDRPRRGAHRLFWGDPHIHSSLSKDLDGEQDELYQFARDVAGVDFVAFTENDCTRFTEPLTPADRETIRRNAEAFNAPGRFTAFLGWEYTPHESPLWPGSRNSHRCVLFPGTDVQFEPCWDGRTVTPPDLARKLHGRDVLLHHHHPSGYDITDDSIECNIEICSGWWNCMRRPEFVERLHGLLDRGLRLGFIGGGDIHCRNPGLGGALTGVWAEENTRASLFEALRERRVFATTGLRPDLRFQVGDTFMGGVGSVASAPIVRLCARCDTTIQRVAVIRDGAVVHESRGDRCSVELEWEDSACPPGRHYYYAHLTFAPPRGDIAWQQPMPLPFNQAPPYGVDAWASPVWITRDAAQKTDSGT